MLFNNIDNTNINYNDIDIELRDLIKCLNNIKNIKTLSCCCGHGKSKCQIFFAINSLDVLNKFCFYYLNPFYNWHCIVQNNVNKNNDYLIICLESNTSNYTQVVFEINKLVEKIKNYDL